jgi:hypothetical protein
MAGTPEAAGTISNENFNLSVTEFLNEKKEIMQAMVPDQFSIFARSRS